MNETIEILNEGIKRFSPYILGGVVGSVIHRLRTKMTWREFLASTVISIFVALSVGIICKDYFEIKQDTIIFVFCGMAGSFSKDILDEMQQIIGQLSVIIKARYANPQ